jgi:DNA polymerase-3 subunit beta
MNIKIKREQLLPALISTSSVVEKRQTLPILSNLHLKQKEGVLSITGSNLEVEVNKTLSGVSSDEIEITLAANKLVDICRALPPGSNINIKIEPGKAILTSAKSRFTLKTLPANEFPLLQAVEYKERFTLPVREFKEILELTSFSMAAQDVRYYLNGILLEVDNDRLVAVATDGHRLSKSEARLDNNQTPDKHQIIIPRKAIQEIMRLLNSVAESESGAKPETVKLELNNKHLKLSASDTIITSTLINGQFPEYESILSADLDKSIQIDRQQFLESLTRISVLTNDRLHGVRLHFKENVLKISTNNPEQEEAEDELPCVYDGEEITTSFNVNYIIEALKVTNSEHMIINIKDKDSVCLLQKPGDELSSWLVMPMRL